VLCPIAQPASAGFLPCRRGVQPAARRPSGAGGAGVAAVVGRPGEGVTNAPIPTTRAGIAVRSIAGGPAATVLKGLRQRSAARGIHIAVVPVARREDARGETGGANDAADDKGDPIAQPREHDLFVPFFRSGPPGKSTTTVRPGGTPEGSPGQGPGKRGEPTPAPRRGGGALLGPSVSRALGSDLPHLVSPPKVSLLLEAKSIGLPEDFFCEWRCRTIRRGIRGVAEDAGAARAALISP
jgi:hypothetical protein